MCKALAAIIFLCVVFSAKAQSVKTETPAEKRLKEIISLVNTYNADEATKYIRANYAPDYLQTQSLEELRAFISRMNDECKHLAVASIDAKKPGEATALVRLKLTGVWRNLVIHTEPASPDRITLVNMQLATPPPGEPIKRKPVSDEAASAELDGLLKKLAKENIFSGNVLVAKKGKIVFHKAYGKASKEYGYPNKLTTKFILGSINKMFTATGILQLIEQNIISLEDPVSKLLPGVLADSIARKINIKHLLTHTSGLGDFLFTPEMSQKSKDNFRTIADYLPTLANDTLFFEPGTQWRYSNAGFLVLGAILEKVSGLPYEEYMKKNIYQPAGMVSTFFPELDNVNQGLAETYEKDYLTGNPVFHNTRYIQVIKGTPAGGGFSTCTDLLHFLQSLAAGKLLKPATVELMQSSKPEMHSPGYGYGTEIFDAESFGHTGGGPGTFDWVKVNRKTGLTIIVLGNTNTGTNIVVRTAQELF
jgi:CubicO group peptidase (beta-lactamase class C family)